jgi:two-component system heavy metal sensor histidine kinase CusS
VQVICAGSGQLWGDPLLFRRAVSNLLSNALQHTPPDGRIEINAHTHADGASEVIVRDSGVGIPAEHLPRIFDRFYRVDRARTQAGHGAGLGLALVQSIMRLHGGAATIDSTVGKGTAVTLHFPPVAAAPNHAQVAGM